MNITNFNNKLQATNFELKKGSNIIQKKNYQFYEDGALKYSQDVKDAKFDRLYKYDFQGRTTIATTSAIARGETIINPTTTPYSQNFSYNAFDNMTHSQMQHYSSNTDYQTHTYINNRKTFTYQNLSVVYDAEGNEISDENNVYEFDASGELVKTTAREEENSSTLINPTTRHIDGTGKELKRHRSWLSPYNNQTYNYINYYIYSSVTGKLVSETNGTGDKLKTYVSANGTTLAEQNKEIANTDRIIFNHQDASGASLQQTKADGLQIGGGEAEFDAVGNNVGHFDPYIELVTLPEGESSTNLTNSAYGFDNQGNPHLRQKYLRDGIEVPESNFRRMIDIGAIGGQFGILQMTARMSTQIVGYKYRAGYLFKKAEFGPSVKHSAGTIFVNDQGIPDKEGMNVAVGMWSTREAIYNKNWSSSLSLISWVSREDNSNHQAFHKSNSMSSFRSKKPNIVGFNKEQKDRIIAQLNYMTQNNEACKKAFQDAGLKTVNELLQIGLTLVSNDAINSARDEWDETGNDEMRTEVTYAFNKQSNWNTNDITPYWGPYNNRYYAFFRKDRMFAETDNTVEYIIVHALMHAAGAVSQTINHVTKYGDERYSIKDGFVADTHTRKAPIHDLEYMNYRKKYERNQSAYSGDYDAIIKACVKKK
jgi:hypothetical protein